MHCHSTLRCLCVSDKNAKCRSDHCLSNSIIHRSVKRTLSSLTHLLLLLLWGAMSTGGMDSTYTLRPSSLSSLMVAVAAADAL